MSEAGVTVSVEVAEAVIEGANLALARGCVSLTFGSQVRFGVTLTLSLLVTRAQWVLLLL